MEKTTERISPACMPYLSNGKNICTRQLSFDRVLQLNHRVIRGRGFIYLSATMLMALHSNKVPAASVVRV